MSKEVSKSPEMLQKEATIKELQANLKKRRSILKGLKTRLDNSKKEIEEVQFKSSTQIVGIMERMEELRLEIIELAKKLKKLKSLSKKDQAAMGAMAEELESEDMLPEDYKEFQRQRKERKDGNFEFDFEEQERAKIRDIFKEFHVKPDEKEQKDIRKVFVKLANKFHPDRARTEKEAAEFHEMQQRLNEAYQSGDIQTLLELERLYLMEELDLSEAKSYTVDVLQKAIEKLEQELQFIENQISRYQQEIKNLRASDFGSMLTHLKKAKKEGFGFEDSLADMESSVAELSQMRDAMKESLEMGELSPKMMAMAYGPLAGDSPFGPLDPDMNPDEMMDLLNEMMGGGGMFEKMNAHSAQAHKEAKFKIDDTVKVKRAIKHLDGTSLKGFVGRVSFIDFDIAERLEYEISLDSVSLKKLPKKLIQDCTDDYEDFQNILILEKDLELCEPRDTLEESIATYRTLYHQHNWKYLGKSKEKRIQSLLLANPALNDEANIEHYLNTNISYPFVGKIRGLMNNPSDVDIQVLGFSDFDPEDGHIMYVKLGKQKGVYPLFDIKGTGKNPKLDEFLNDYKEWQADSLDDDDDFFF